MHYSLTLRIFSFCFCLDCGVINFLQSSMKTWVHIQADRLSKKACIRRGRFVRKALRFIRINLIQEFKWNRLFLFLLSYSESSLYLWFLMIITHILKRVIFDSFVKRKLFGMDWFLTTRYTLVLLTCYCLKFYGENKFSRWFSIVLRWFGRWDAPNIPILSIPCKIFLLLSIKKQMLQAHSLRKNGESLTEMGSNLNTLYLNTVFKYISCIYTCISNTFG